MSCSNQLSYFSYFNFVFFKLWKRRDSNPRPRRNERSNTILRHLYIIKTDKVKGEKGIFALMSAALTRFGQGAGNSTSARDLRFLSKTFAQLVFNPTSPVRSPELRYLRTVIFTK